MKTQNYSLLIVPIILVATLAFSMQKVNEHRVSQYSSDNQLTDADINNLFNPAVKANPGVYLQDLSIYNVSGTDQVAISYIPEPAASTVGYMGFKVGDEVKWGSAVDKKMLQEYGNGKSYLTGSIAMLDSDKCYIRIDNTRKVAVKPYEDITKASL